MHTIALCATDSTGANIVLGSAQAWVQVGSSHYAGPVGDTGCRQEAVADGTTVTVWVAKAGTYSQQQTARITADTVFNFYTTKVTLQYSGGLAYGGVNGDSAWFPKPSMEMFSNGVTPIRFRLDGTGGAAGRIGLIVPLATGPGVTYTRSLIALRLIDSTGQPLNNGTARYRNGSWYYAPGYTGNETTAPGILAYSLPGLVGTITNEMKLNNTVQTVTQNAATNSVYQFRTRALTLALRTAGGDPLAGGQARYGNGSNYSTWWYPGGLTNAGGTTVAQVFPGTYSFQMLYKGTAEAKISVAVPDADTTLSWNTTTVTLSYSGQVSYGGATGDSAWFTKPSMNLLSGTYTFHFRDPAGGGVVVPLTWNGDAFTKSMVIVHLNGHDGSGLPGGVISYAPGGSWISFGTTDSNGLAYLLVDGLLGNVQVRVAYHNGSATQSANQPTHSIFTFGTVAATISLVDHSGLPLAGGTVHQGGGAWIPVGTTDASGTVTFEVLDGIAGKFRVSYHGGSQEITQNVALPFVFQTGSVFSESGHATMYAQGSWQTFTQNIELMPGNWHFSFTDFPVTYYDIVAGTVNPIH